MVCLFIYILSSVPSFDVPAGTLPSKTFPSYIQNHDFEQLERPLLRQHIETAQREFHTVQINPAQCELLLPMHEELTSAHVQLQTANIQLHTTKAQLHTVNTQLHTTKSKLETATAAFHDVEACLVTHKEVAVEVEQVLGMVMEEVKRELELHGVKHKPHTGKLKLHPVQLELCAIKLLA
ncbi:hypothetical protein B0H10DRAFT_2209541 [Mycena sp. CBHHK59/15]|nr:hypothetical protein B0H10DRAFT_2209541 [Mycena sp. CBHHK59/15]